MPATRVSQGQTFKVLAIVEAMSRRKGMWLVAPLLALLFLLPAVRLVHYIYFDRSGLPDLERFIRFEIPTTGEVYDAQGTVLVELAREYRRVVSYDEVPPVLRDAILAAEDRNFFTTPASSTERSHEWSTRRSCTPWPPGGTASGFGCIS